MHGWSGRALVVDLTNTKYSYLTISEKVLMDFLGGRGIAVKLLWDLNEVGTDPLSPKNHLIFAVGPLTGYPLPSSGKVVIASKSPLTGGYGDGNIGTKAAVELRKLGVDALVLKGAARRPTILLIRCDGVEFSSADNIWGLGTHEAEERLSRMYGGDVGILTIGPAGENLVRFATVISEYGRSGGRPGMGAVMGSKNVKAIVIKGCSLPQPHSRDELVKLGAKAYEEVRKAKAFSSWLRQGTMATIEWSQRNSVLPTYNFREGVFDGADKLSGAAMEKHKVSQKGCPLCNMPCGNIVEYDIDLDGLERFRAELDYENVAMLGSNLGIDDLGKVSYLNNLADDLGLDTISLGSAIAFAMEASEKGLLEERVEWGDFKAARQLAIDIARREGLGELLSLGVRYASGRVGKGSDVFAMHVKGLEVTAYDCHAAPGMALAYGTSPIGAHHKDAWFISLELEMGRFSYSLEKVSKLVWMQNVRGGLFESLVSCRLPWVELGLNLDTYPKLLKAATGYTLTWDDLYTIAQRIYALIRAFWVREYVAEGRGWGRGLDYPPPRWFTEPLSKGPLAGSRLDREGFDAMLSRYYELRGWDDRGIPRRGSLEALGLNYVANKLSEYVELTD